MTPPENLITGLMLALSIGSVAYTISSSKVSMPLRLAITKRAVRTKSKRLRWLADLLSCPYCVSHWLAFAATIVYRPWLVGVRGLGPFGRVFDFLVTSMALVTLAMAAVWLIKRALAPTGPADASGGGQPHPGHSERINRSAPERVASRPVVPRGHGPTNTQVMPPTQREDRRPATDVTLSDPLGPLDPLDPPGAGPTDRTQVIDWPSRPNP